MILSHCGNYQRRSDVVGQQPPRPSRTVVSGLAPVAAARKVVELARKQRGRAKAAP
jgi:hypothetical protein